MFKLVNGTETRVVGGLDTGYRGDGGDPSEALLWNPRGIFVTKTGDIYVADQQNALIRKVANLCNDYQFSAYFDTKKMKANRICMTNSEFFYSDYLPRVQVIYNSTKEEKEAFAVEWNTFQTVPMTGQYLDLVTISIDSCYTPESIVTNCSFYYHYGVVPTAVVSNFVLFPHVLSVSILNYFKTSPLVLSLQITAQLYHDNVWIRTMVIESGSITTEFSGLNASTQYTVQFDTVLIYTNGLRLVSTQPSIQSVTTQSYIRPSSTVQNIKADLQSDTIVLLWQSVPEGERGNLPIIKLEIQYSSTDNNLETQIISIDYIGETNTPSSYPLRPIRSNTNYTFEMRVCNSIDCSIFSDHITLYVPLSNIATSGLDVTISIAIVCVMVGIFALIALLLSCVLLLIIICICVLKRRQQSIIATTFEVEILDELVSKDFRLDESKIDMTSSKFLGSGASGSVYTAKYFNIDVAIKMIQKSNAGLENDLTEFYNELKFLNNNAQHMNVIRFFGVYENTNKNLIGLVMEYCSNGDVANYVTKHELSINQKVNLMQGIANGMQYLHHHNIAHRDLKCENVLLDSQLTPKIIDFGYSREIKEEANKSLHLTMNIGTAAYCAPEVIKNQFSTPQQSTIGIETSNFSTSTNTIHSNHSVNRLAYNKSCDVYSFAITMYVIYFGTKQPYGGNVTDNQILFKLSSDPHFRPKINEDQIPTDEKWIIELVKECWKSDPNERPSFEYICEILSKHA